MIVSGPDNEDKSVIVNALAASILCSGVGNKPCGVCPDCKKAAENIHPDLITLSPPKDKAEISVGQVRELRAGVPVVPNDSKCKVYIISSADKMNTAAQNVLLKTLEEPPSFAYFILSAENPGLLLPTVRSRCAELRFTCGDDPDIPDESAKTAEKLIELYLSGDRFELTSYINSLEKTDRTAFADISSAVRRNAAGILASSPPYETKTKLIKLVKTFDKVSEYLDMNVGIVHILGLLMSELV